MTQKEVLEQARTCLGKYCKGCQVCNGRGCRNQIPGPGAKGIGDTAIRNYDKWKEIRVQMDTLCENRPQIPAVSCFGRSFAYPFFAGPVGAVNLHYGEKYDDASYNDILVSACAKAGIAAFTGDGTNPEVMRAATEAIKAAVRHRGHVGAVRFQHDAVERQLLNNFNGFFCVFKSYGSAETEFQS